MKITSAEIFCLQLSLGQDMDKVGNWHPIIVRLETDDGISGIGEAGLAYGHGLATNLDVRTGSGAEIQIRSVALYHEAEIRAEFHKVSLVSYIPVTVYGH